MMNGESLNIQQDNLSKLKELFPNLFTEDKLDWEKLKAAFSDDINFSNERYILNWAGKADAFKALQIPTTATLKPAPEESINFDTTENIFIEGENLEVLKVLQKSYYNKIKCIIIDPPYNTGSDSFIYPDSFKENKEEYQKRIGDKDEEGYLMKEGMFRKNSKDSGHFHSNWLSMMYPRLFLSKNLLCEEGAIFIFIDDNEVHNLRLLMNEIFGEENFVAAIAWKHTQQSKNDEKYFSRHYNTIVVYRKTDKLKNFRFNRTEENNVNYSNPDNDINGEWRSGDVRSPNYRKTLCYDIDTPSGRKISAPQKGWRWSKEELLKKIKSGEIIFNKEETKIIRKIYLKDQVGRMPENLWDGEEYGTTRIANAEIKELFDDEAIFDTPKPTQVIRKILELILTEGSKDIILDFFAGSATTAHGIITQNKFDGYNSKFILVQLPEKCEENSVAYKAGYHTIADISKERIRRVIKEIENEKGENPDMFDDGQHDLGFKVFKLTPSNFKIWRSNEINEENLVRQLEAFTNPVHASSPEQNMLYELILKSGYLLTDKVEIFEIVNEGMDEKKHIKSSFYIIADGELIIALDKINPQVIELIIEQSPKKVIMLDNLFAGNDQLKTNTVLQMKDAGIDFKTI